MAIGASTSSAVLRAALFSKVALVTGAASGIGLAISSLLASHGATVVMVDVDLIAVTKAAKNIPGSKAHAYQCDIASWQQQRHLFACVLERFFRLDIVCCNAGIDPELLSVSRSSGGDASTRVAHNWLADEVGPDRAPTHNTHPRAAKEGLLPPPDHILATNTQGTIYGAKLAIHHMRRLNYQPPNASSPSSPPTRHIIFTGSMAAYVGYPGQDLYCASKHALLGLLRATSQRAELRKERIAMAMVAPGLVQTAMVEGLGFLDTANGVQEEDGWVEGGVSRPEDVARVVGELICGEWAETNGRVMWVEGGEGVLVEKCGTGAFGAGLRLSA